MDIVVKGRNVEVPDHFRTHVAEKLSLCERLDARVFRIDVELIHERNPRQSSQCQRIEITAASKGPVIRAEACAADFYAALDTAVLKLEARLRKAHDRRRVHHGSKVPPSVAEATAGLPAETLEATVGRNGHSAESAYEHEHLQATAVLDRPAHAEAAEAAEPEGDDTRELIVRDKTHVAQPMSTPQALHEMELVGHDFFLYSCTETGLPSVVYRRHGYDYGVIRLAAE